MVSARRRSISMKADIFLDFESAITSSIKKALTGKAALTAEELSAQVVDDIARNFGGMQIYFPYKHHQNQERSLAIFREWGKISLGEMVKKYGITQKYLYRAYKAGRKLAISKSQGDLFASTPQTPD